MAERAVSRPTVQPDEQSAPFFDGARRGELMLLACVSCGYRMWPTSHAGSLPVHSRCHECFSAELEWVAASGDGTLFSFAVMHQPYPGFEEAVPYNVALVELAEGVRCLSSVIGCDNSELRIGMALRVEFEPGDGEEPPVPRFRRVP